MWHLFGYAWLCVSALAVILAGLCIAASRDWRKP